MAATFTMAWAAGMHVSHMAGVGERLSSLVMELSAVTQNSVSDSFSVI